MGPDCFLHPFQQLGYKINISAIGIHLGNVSGGNEASETIDRWIESECFTMLPHTSEHEKMLPLHQECLHMAKTGHF